MKASFIIFKLPPYFENFGKRVIKSPKYYFTDTGLLTYLLDIEKPEQLSRDPLVGQLFENLVVLEALKQRYNQGLTPNLYFFRDSNGHELDLLFKSGRELHGLEIKSASTWNQSFKKGLWHFTKNNYPLSSSTVIYTGESLSFSDGITALPYQQTCKLF